MALIVPNCHPAIYSRDPEISENLNITGSRAFARTTEDLENDMQNYIEKAAVLIEALPYIRSFAGKTVVIKYGGAAMTTPALQDAVMQDITLMKFCGMNPVIVHGGGPELSSFCKKMGIEPKFIDGLRVTDAATMEMAQMILFGKTNREIVTRLNLHGARAIGLTGQDGNLLISAKRKHKDIKTNQWVDLGFVGDITSVNINIIESLTSTGYVPVIAPIGMGTDGQAYNINADSVAGEIAAALKAEKLVFLTDVEGLYAEKNNPESLVNQITANEAKEWIQQGKLDGGMIPKLEACMKALSAGTSQVHIIDGRVPHSLLLEIFTDKGIGTMVVNSRSQEKLNIGEKILWI